MTLLRVDLVVTAAEAGWSADALVDGVRVAVQPIASADAAASHVATALDAIRARRCSAADAVLVGRHLFEILLGTIWPQIGALMGATVDRVELALDLEGAGELAFLPWEMMRGPAGYLARGLDRANSGSVVVAITRRVRRGNAAYRPLRHPLRYLFVIGSALNDSVRAGAECLGLLRQIGDHVQQRILLRPSLSQLATIVESFKPDVVHVISHGEIDPATNAAGLKMYDDVVKGEVTVDAELLADKLVRSGEAPAIVLLSACASGAPLAAGACEPLATGLVRAGVPIVVAMAGEIDDLACRVFARAFGEALAQRRSPVWAATLGRRAALRSPALPQDAVDWAMIDVFIGKDISSDVSVLPASENPEFGLVDAWLKRKDVDLLPIFDGKRIAPPFCGRLEIIEEFYKVMAGLRPALCITARPPRNEPLSQLGKKRTLVELAAIATREGHIPVPLLPGKLDDSYPNDMPMLLKQLAGAIKKTRAAYSIVPKDSKLLAAIATQSDLDTCSDALAEDLVLLRDDARSTHTFIAERNGNVVVLMNDVHAYKDATPDLLLKLVTNFGLGQVSAVIPVVMTFRFGGQHDDTFNDSTKEGDKRRTCFGTTMELKPFEPGEDMLAYQRVLLQPYRNAPEAAKKRWFLELHRRPKLVAASQKFFRTGTQGFPGKLWSEGFNVAVESSMPDEDAGRPGIVREASDEDLLDVLQGLP